MSKKMISLRSCDGKVFDVEENVALQSQTIKHMIEDDCTNDVIPLPNVNGKILAMIIEYCNKHVQTPSSNSNNKTHDDLSLDLDHDHDHDFNLKSWDVDFVNVDRSTLSDLISAANYLNIKSLLELTCQKVADMIKGMMPEEVRKIFNIKNDFTPEEEEEVRKENEWAFR